MLTIAFLIVVVAGAVAAFSKGLGNQKFLGIIPIAVFLIGAIPPNAYAVMHPGFHLKFKFWLVAFVVMGLGAAAGGLLLFKFKPTKKLA